MRHIRIWLVLTGFALGFFSARQAYAIPDGATVWPGWGLAGQTSYYDNTVGTPDITGWFFDYSNGFLNSVSFEMVDPAVNQSWGQTAWGKLKAGDLFIDVGADETWDYVALASTGEVYQFAAPLALHNDMSWDNPSQPYLITHTGDPYWSGYTIRYNHPWAISSSGLSGANVVSQGSFSGFPAWESDGTYEPLIFSGLNILLGNNAEFSIGWAINCANDVIYDSTTTPLDQPVPEPATLLLMGSGLAGLAGYGRRRQRA